MPHPHDGPIVVRVGVGRRPTFAGFLLNPIVQGPNVLNIRPATPADIPQILAFIRELALYEREPEAVQATEADLHRDAFGPTPRFRCVLAEVAAPADNGEPTPDNPSPAGFALFFPSYSTWRGHHGLRLEDLYVTPSARGQGIGRALLKHLAQIAVAEGCPRLEWDVLAWNTPAIAFYEQLGAHTLQEWRIMRLADQALQTLASSELSPTDLPRDLS